MKRYRSRWQHRWRRYAPAARLLDALKAGLALAVKPANLRAEAVEMHAHMLLAVLIEAALLIAPSDGDAAVITGAGAAVDTILRSLVLANDG